MKVVFTADKYSSGWYRMRQPMEALEGEVDTVFLREGFRLVSNGAFIYDIQNIPEGTDVVVLLRPMYWFMPQVIMLLQRRGIKVVVDVDDDFHSVHSLNRGFDDNHPKLHPNSNWNHFRTCCKVADLVTCSTPALARRYGSHGKAIVLRNCVDDSWLDIVSKSDGNTVGWAGAISNHPTDLQATRGGVAQAVEEIGARFMCIGGEARLDEVKRQLGFRKDIESSPWIDLELYPFLVAQLDIGIVPLADTKFNEAKSYLKGIEYAVLGIPFVASSTAEYRHLYDEYGLGVLAEARGRAWRRQVKALLGSESLRRELASSGRGVARERLTISKNAWRWAEAWESTLTKEKVAT